MSFISATQGSIMHAILFFSLSFLALNVSANCNNDKCLKALNSDLVVASSFCGKYTTNTAISPPSAISSGCKASSSKILSACSCINTVTTASKTSSTSLMAAKTSSSSHTTSVTTSRATSSASSRSTSSTSNPANLPSTVTVTIVSTKSVTASQAPNSITLPASTTTTTLTVSATATCAAGVPCSLYESAIPSCVLSHIQQDFADFQPGCFGIGIGPSYVKTCICPYLSQLPAFFSSTGLCAAADVTTGLALQQSECQCLGATIG